MKQAGINKPAVTILALSGYKRDNMIQPVLSITCRTFNKEMYIAKALDGFLMQKTNFPFEILISDDCSTDRTLQIVSDYQKNNRNIRIISTQKNKGATYNLYHSIVNSKGDYIALCDGDDYWIDEFKLQKQFDLFQSNLNCKLIFTKRQLEDDGKIVKDKEYYLPDFFTLHELLEKGVMPSTSTIAFKREIIPEKFPDFYFNLILKNDWALLFIIGSNIIIGHLAEETSVYRAGIGITYTTPLHQNMKNGIYVNKNIDKYTNYEFHYHLKNNESHYENITYSYLLHEREILKALKYFLLKVGNTLKYRPKKIISGNVMFLKHCMKLLFRL